MEVRHLNRMMDDDRPENLRPVTTYPDAEVTQEYLCKAFHLNYRTGELFRWIEVQGHLVLETKAAGCLGDSERWQILVLGRLIRRSRLVYLYVHGKMLSRLAIKTAFSPTTGQLISAQLPFRRGIWASEVTWEGTSPRESASKAAGLNFFMLG